MKPYIIAEVSVGDTPPHSRETLLKLAKQCRDEAARIESGPISIFAADMVFDLRSQAHEYEAKAEQMSRGERNG